jgi:hypothetical protein
MRWLFMAALFSASLICLQLAYGDNSPAGEKQKPTSLEDDFRALTADWVKRLMMELSLKAEKFPNFRVTVFRLDKLKDDMKGDVEATRIYEGQAKLEEKDGKRFLTIEGQSILFGFDAKARFLELTGEFAHRDKKINLTGTWGKVVASKEFPKKKA